jgi:hypothetical protein
MRFQYESGCSAAAMSAVRWSTWCAAADPTSPPGWASISRWCGSPVRSATKGSLVEVAPAELTTDALAVATAADIDVIVEVIGGIEPARELILEA